MELIVRRAREEQSLAEMELLSSTSSEVCEVWTGTQIVRIKGQCPPDMKDLVITKQGLVLGMKEAWDAGYFDCDELSAEEVGEELHHHDNAAPNLSLNVLGDPKQLAKTTLTFAIIGVFLQAGAVVSSWVVEHLLHLPGRGGQSSSYGNACYLVGTVLVSAGLLACAHVIEAATIEVILKAKPEYKDSIAILRLQQSCKVGDQQLESTAVFNPFDNPNIHTSRWAKDNSKKHRYLPTQCLKCLPENALLTASFAQYNRDPFRGSYNGWRRSSIRWTFWTALVQRPSTIHRDGHHDCFAGTVPERPRPSTSKRQNPKHSRDSMAGSCPWRLASQGPRKPREPRNG